MAKRNSLKWAVPKELNIPPDPLRCRLDFYHQAVRLTLFEGEGQTSKIVSAMDVAYALATDLSFGTGLLPPGTIWWRNTRGGPVYAIYVEPKIWKIALQLDVRTPPRRFTLPMPGLVFMCSPGKPPWVYAVKKKPTKETDDVYNAPLSNIHENGRSCAGTHKYPTRIADTVQSFFTSFFTTTANLKNRSVKFPSNVVLLWESLDNRRKFPVADLVRIGRIKDLMDMEM